MTGWELFLIFSFLRSGTFRVCLHSLKEDRTITQAPVRSGQSVCLPRRQNVAPSDNINRKPTVIYTSTADAVRGRNMNSSAHSAIIQWDYLRSFRGNMPSVARQCERQLPGAQSGVADDRFGSED
jgi:hypothetical protein